MLANVRRIKFNWRDVTLFVTDGSEFLPVKLAKSDKQVVIKLENVLLNVFVAYKVKNCLRICSENWFC